MAHEIKIGLTAHYAASAGHYEARLFGSGSQCVGLLGAKGFFALLGDALARGHLPIDLKGIIKVNEGTVGHAGQTTGAAGLAATRHANEIDRACLCGDLSCNAVDEREVKRGVLPNLAGPERLGHQHQQTAHGRQAQGFSL